MSTLHRVLQVVMGWTDSHLHEFQVGPNRIGIPDSDDPMTIDERHVWLGKLMEEGVRRLAYTYDFGDDWEHDVVIESRGEPDPAARYPRCLAGKRACPPEDCGGPYGYVDLLQASTDPENEEWAELREWAGEIHPERFDPDAVNRRLARLKLTTRPPRPAARAGRRRR